MIKNINLSQDIHTRLFAISRQVGRKEDDLIEEAIITYLEDFEDIKDAQERLFNPPDRYLTLEEVEEELGLANNL